MRSTLVRATVWLTVATLVATAAGWWDGARAARRQVQPVAARIYLPLVAARADLAALAPPRALPSPTPGRAPTATPTERGVPPTVPPTFTPAPTTTPTPAGEGAITGRLLVNGSPAIEGLGEGFGPGLFLVKCGPGQSGMLCPRIGRTAVYGPEGRYTFASPPTLAPGEYYQVHWRNETYDDLFGIDEWLGAWFSRRIVDYVAGQTVEVEDIELHNIALLRPTHGTGFGGLPVTFAWETRPDEEYEYVLCDCCGDGFILRETGRPNFHSPPVAGRGEYTLNALPPGFQVGIDYKYCWYIHVRGTGGSYGMSYDHRMLWFFFQDAVDTLLGGLPGARLTAR